MTYQLTDKDRRIKTIAIEEHYSTPLQRQELGTSEFRSFYISSRSEHLGYNIIDQLADLGEQRLAYMDAAGVDIQVLSFTSPGAQAFAAQRPSRSPRMPTTGSMKPCNSTRTASRALPRYRRRRRTRPLTSWSVL